MESTISCLGVTPDISVNAKILTGGLVPLAVTLASDSIFQAFYSENKADALLHGHSYTAHPLGCEVANETLRLIDKERASDAWNAAQKRWEVRLGEPSMVWSFWDPQFVQTLSRMDMVSEVMALGTVLSIKVKDSKAGRLTAFVLVSLASKPHSSGYVSHSAQTLLQSLKSREGTRFSVHFRTLGDVAYFMTSLNTSPQIIREVEDKIWKALQQQK
jgi:dethiobiotin synthetase/adenosylmethionine--8-amino-7-oxononanoate aminotransferase